MWSYQANTEEEQKGLLARHFNFFFTTLFFWIQSYKNALINVSFSIGAVRADFQFDHFTNAWCMANIAYSTYITFSYKESNHTCFMARQSCLSRHFFQNPCDFQYGNVNVMVTCILIEIQIFVCLLPHNSYILKQQQIYIKNRTT